MSGDYTSREAAIVRATKVLADDFDAYNVKVSLQAIPAADVVEVRHGRWEWDGGEDMHYYCSLCHHKAYGCTTEILDGKYRYCPSCGAKMDGGMDNG